MNQLRAFAPLFGLLFGSILLGLGGINLRGAIASRSWVPVAAVVTRSAVETGGVRERITAPTIEYAYVLAGQPHTGDRIRYGLVTSPSSARSLVARYAAGDTVRVFVDPDNPDRSVLQRSGAALPAAQVLGGMALLGVWLAAARQERRERRSRS